VSRLVVYAGTLVRRAQEYRRKRGLWRALTRLLLVWPWISTMREQALTRVEGIRISSRNISEGGVWTNRISLHDNLKGEVFFRSRGGPFSGSSDQLVPLGLLTAMSRSAPLVIRGSVSPRLAGNIGQIQSILRGIAPGWNARLQIVPATFNAAATQLPSDRRVGCFFSCGVDSFHTALRHREEIDQLVFVHGFDVRLKDRKLDELVTSKVREAAAALELPLLEVETDVKNLFDTIGDWDLVHGAAKAIVAHLLQPSFRKFYVAGTYSEDQIGRFSAWLPANGSAPLIDSLWATENVELVHDGLDVTRPEKAALIVSNEVVQRTLHVCWQNPNAEYNCCVCGKCTATMASIAAAGKLEQCVTFPRPLDLDILANDPLATSTQRIRVIENLEFIDKVGGNTELRRALQHSLDAYNARAGAAAGPVGAKQSHGFRIGSK
jgi:hypothetical protein